MQKRDALFLTFISIVVVGFLLTTIGDYGLTADEPFYFRDTHLVVRWGAELLDAATGDPAAHPLSRASLERAFGGAWDPAHRVWPPYGHPPFTRYVRALTFLALRSGLGEIAAIRAGTMVFAIAALWLLYALVLAWRGRGAAMAAVLALLAMPRLYPEWQLAMLDAPVLAMWLAVTYAFARGLDHPRWRVAAGLLYGCGLATKFHFVLLPVPLALWALVTARRRAIPPLLRLILPALPVAYALDPHLWLGLADGLRTYAVINLQRSEWALPLHTWYLGARTLHGAPWHYPWVLLVVTLPPTLLLAAAVGAWRARRRRHPWDGLILLQAAFPPALLMLPRAPGHDGIRLFLAALPFVAALAGDGIAALAARLAPARPRRAIAVALLLLVPAALAVARTHPYQLSYYGEAIGGLRGARALGFETTYAGEAVNPAIFAAVNRLPTGARLRFFPAHGNALMLYRHYGWLRSDLAVTNGDDWAYLVFTHREGFYRPEMNAGTVAGLPRLATASLEGVPLVELIGRSAP